MKSILVSLLVFCSLSVQAQIFHSLEGIENQQGVTILLYRAGNFTFDQNPVYKFNTSTLSEEIIISNNETKGCTDFEFFPSSEIKFMNTGYIFGTDTLFHIGRNDTIVFSDQRIIRTVDISRQNPMKVFVFDTGVIRSFDGGYSFPPDSTIAVTNFNPVSLAGFDDNTFFGFLEEGGFAKNGGVVDTAEVVYDRYFKMVYDKDQMHVYRINKTYGNYSLNVSDNMGNVFTWSKTFESADPVFFTNDSLVPGTVYITEKNIIRKSTDYGYSFSDYKTLPYRILGIYKKPGTEILYAATRYRIYKITPGTIEVVKALPIPADILNFYPLAKGNKWVFDEHTWVWGWPPEYYHRIITKEVLGDSTALNGKQYKFIKDQTSFNEVYNLERVDPTDGKIYRFAEGIPEPDEEYVVDDLLAEPGDSIDSYRGGYSDYGKTVFLAEDTFIRLGFNEPKRIYVQENLLLYPYYSLTRNIGMDSLSYGFDFGQTDIILKGCYLNGIVYGDTTVTAVEDLIKTPDNFILLQNYPNPFNPLTTIKYNLPVREFVSLKVYDVIGREIVNLVNEEQSAGIYEIPFSGINLSSGVYIYQIRAGSYMQNKKMILLK